MPWVYVSIGSNVDRKRQIRAACAALKEHYGPLRVSPVYENRAVGFEGDDFFNLVVGFESRETPQAIAGFLRELERAQGRRRDGPRFGDRPIDLDLILYGDLVTNSPRLRLPRPDILEYGFVLRPLADIAPDLRHPETGATCRELWQAFGAAGSSLRRLEFDPCPG